MAVKQVSIFLENKAGQMAEVIKKISEEEINLRAMSVGEAKDFGVLRLIVSDAEKAQAVLSDRALVRLTDVIAVRMDDIAGALYTILKALEEAAINVEYSYASPTHQDNAAFVIFRVDDVAAAEKVLSDKGFAFITEAEL